MKLYTIILVGIFTFLLSACEKEVSKMEVLSKEDAKVEIAKDVKILYSDSAVVRIQIQGPTLVNHTTLGNLRREFPDGVAVDFFDADQKVTSRMTAKYAIQFNNQRKVFIRDSVVVVGVNETLKTEGLIWDENKQRISSDRFVTITTPDERIEGYGFESDQDFINWEIKKVIGRFKIENNEF